jgi:transposase-like protein
MRKYTKYSSAEKFAALKLVIEQGKSIPEASEQSGVAVSTLHEWVKKHKNAPKRIVKKAPEEHSELSQLKKEVEWLRKLNKLLMEKYF